MPQTRLPSISPIIVNSPLWQRAPVRDANGKPYIDFMMLIPGLNKACGSKADGIMHKIQHSLKDYESDVVYVDLNIRLNILWVSLKPIPGKSGQIVRAIQQAIPHAKVVASDVESGTRKNVGQSVVRWGKKLLDPVKEKWALLEKK